MQLNVSELAYTCAAYILLAFGLRCLVVYGYRLTLHPLSKYPGPFLAKVTSWHAVYYSATRDLHLRAYLDHQKYGRVIRHGPNKLVFNSVQALRDIYLSERTNKVRSLRITQVKPNAFSVFSCIDKRLHRIKRRMISKALSEQKMRQFEPVIQQYIQIFLKQLLKSSSPGASEPVNITDRCKRLGLDIIGQFAFGYTLNLQTEKTNRFVISGLAASNYRSNVHIQAPLAKWMGVDAVILAFLARRLLRYYYLIKRLIKGRLAEGKYAKDDLFASMVDAKDPETGTKIRMSELWTEAIFLVAAGGDTTAATISAAFFYLSRYPECYSRLVSEIRSTFSHGDEIRGGPQLSQCTYLRAVINETMRMSPPVAGTSWRELPVDDKRSKEPLVIDGHVVHAGTWIGVNVYTIHHNEEYFPEPFVFKPERWLEGGAGTSTLEASIPFGMGSRSCAGKTMAYLESSLVLAKTMWYFDFDRPQDAKLDKVGGGTLGSSMGRDRVNEFQIHDQLVGDHTGPCLVFHPRGKLWEDLKD